MTSRRFRPPATAAIERLLRPRSVAVVGASPTTGALGASVLSNLERMGFSGDVYLVNPKRSEIGGRRCLPSVDDLPPGVDAAVLAIPRAAVLTAIEALARRKAGAAIIFSAGFAEGGSAGVDEQREIARIAAEHGMVIEGPNCLGLVNYVDGVALTFVETPAVALGDRPGVGIVSQSGALAAVLGVMLASRGIGISYSISTGNEAASTVEDYIEHLIDDRHTRVFGMIVEQFRHPQRFLSLVQRARAQGKLIVLLHPGRSSAARVSAATHTGAIAGDYQVMRTKVERAGGLFAENLEALGDLIHLAMGCHKRPSHGTAVLTESGAFKALTLDLAEQIQLELPPLSDASAPDLRSAMPEFVPVSNPLDLTAQALVDPDLYRRTMAALLHDGRFGTIVLGIIQTDPATSNLKFPPIIRAIDQLKPDKSVIFAGLDEGAVVPASYIAELAALGVPYFPSPDRALRAVARFCELERRDFSSDPAPPLQAEGLPDNSGVVPEYRAKAILGKLGIPFPAGRLVTSLEDARAAAATLGFPVALKAQSAALSHKSDAGGVVLGLADDAALTGAWERLDATLAQRRPGLVLDGVLVEKMGRPGTELIVGARHDAEWGPVVLVGFGGVEVEVLKDIRLIPPDLGQDGIVHALHRLRSSALFSGFRGARPLDVLAVARLISTLGRLLRGEPSIREIDLNPVVVYPEGEGVVALDALMLVGGVAA